MKTHAANFLFFALSRSFALSVSASEVSLSRHFMITTCHDADRKCGGPVVKDIENANVKIVLRSYSKGPARGLTGVDENSFVEEGVPFHSEIRVTTLEGREGYRLYIMLRSGAATARHGIVRIVNLKNMKDLELVLLSDKQFHFEAEL